MDCFGTYFTHVQTCDNSNKSNNNNIKNPQFVPVCIRNSGWQCLETHGRLEDVSPSFHTVFFFEKTRPALVVARLENFRFSVTSFGEGLHLWSSEFRQIITVIIAVSGWYYPQLPSTISIRSVSIVFRKLSFLTTPSLRVWKCEYFSSSSHELSANAQAAFVFLAESWDQNIDDVTTFPLDCTTKEYHVYTDIAKDTIRVRKINWVALNDQPKSVIGLSFFCIFHMKWAANEQLLGGRRLTILGKKWVYGRCRPRICTLSSFQKMGFSCTNVLSEHLNPNEGGTWRHSPRVKSGWYGKNR